MRLVKNLNHALAPIRDRRAELIKNPDDIWDVLRTGKERAQNRAGSVMEKVRKAMKTDYRGGKKK